jgi:hypothetical protein
MQGDLMAEIHTQGSLGWGMEWSNSYELLLLAGGTLLSTYNYPVEVVSIIPDFISKEPRQRRM